MATNVTTKVLVPDVPDQAALKRVGEKVRKRLAVNKDIYTLPTDQAEIFALGDAANLPTSKAGSVAHFSVEVFIDNLVQLAHGRPMTHSFDGHANCFVESGHGKALLLDFNYETEPLTGTFPVPGVGPLRLLKESRFNHLSKLAFRHIYWNALLPGRPLGLKPQMSMAGKHLEGPPAAATASMREE